MENISTDEVPSFKINMYRCKAWINLSGFVNFTVFLAIFLTACNSC